MEPSILKITYIGHATALIQLGNQYFLTDPNFSNRIWPWHHRLQPPGLPAYQLPPLNALVVSQAHYDHLDIFSYKYFKSTVPIIVPKGLGKFLRKFLENAITELEPGGSHREFETTIHSVPTLKYGYRHLPLRYRAATGYVFQSPQGVVYFPGDTGYGPHFSEIGKQFKIDVALLPIQPNGHGAGPKSSLNPLKALQALEDLGAKVMIPTQWDAFKMGKRQPEEWVEELRELARQRDMADKIHVLQPGDSFQRD